MLAAGPNIHAEPELRPERGEPDRTAGRAVRPDDLAGLTHEELRAAWRRLYRSNPPKKLGRELLELGIAWKEQEQAVGGLGAATRRRLAELARTIETDGDLAKARAVRLRPGARLVRNWGGVTHEVLVLEDGFGWRGERWRSLSANAREITGARWSGPRFFGLGGGEKATARRPAAEARLARLSVGDANA